MRTWFDIERLKAKLNMDSENLKALLATNSRAYERITQEEYLIIDELRSFRYVFRNLYSRPLDRSRLQALQLKAPSAVQLFVDALARYNVFLTEMEKHLEG